MSRLHASVERIGTAYVVRDLGSSNGTFVNGDAIASDLPLRPGDEITVGRTTIVFHGESDHLATTTDLGGRVSLSRREREILVALCRILAEAAHTDAGEAIRRLGEHLSGGDVDVAQEVDRLYSKFEVAQKDRAPQTLAARAVSSGAIALAELGPSVDAEARGVAYAPDDCGVYRWVWLTGDDERS